MDVSIIEAVAVLKCSSCGRGELILQSKPQEIFSYRARVTQALEAETRNLRMKARPEDVPLRNAR